MTIGLLLGNCLERMAELPDCSVDAIVTDPPYGISFMGKKWDYDVPSIEIWAECLRVLKPGGHLLAFAGTRTQHRMAVRIEDAGFEIRDMIAWVYGSGFPKSLDVSKAINKTVGDEQGEARQWAGWGTALKPALEPITMARKPLEGTVAANVLQHGCGGLNIDACRVGAGGENFDHLKGRPLMKINNRRTDEESLNGAAQQAALAKLKELGRWPANLIHDGSDEVVGLFPEAGNGWKRNYGEEDYQGRQYSGGVFGGGGYKGGSTYCDCGSAARFFYCAKTSKRERGEGNTHPTVKPIALMTYLCRLVTPPGGIVLDPFMGSGSTGIAALQGGFNFIGIEREPDYMDIAKRRIEEAKAKLNNEGGIV